MQRSRKGNRIPKVFLDSSVVIAATLSFSGGSFCIIRDSISHQYKLLISNYILEECIRILKEKYPQKLFILTLILDSFSFEIVKDPPSSEVERLIKIIDFRDAPVLAAALKHKVRYLITLDKKDFLGPKVLEFAQRKQLLILTPGEFLEELEI